MKYDVEYTCGHKGKVELFGPNKEREYRLQKISFDLCPECQEKVEKEKYEEMRRESESMGLPELTGSEKQIRWASSIRIQIVKEIYSKINHDSAKSAEMIKAIKHGVMCHTDSRFWIDRRIQTARQIAKEFWNEWNEKSIEDMKNISEGENISEDENVSEDIQDEKIIENEKKSNSATLSEQCTSNEERNVKSEKQKQESINRKSEMQIRRKELGLSQSQLAERAGISVRMVQNYEQGVRDLKKAEALTVLKIAVALGCTVEDLIKI